MIDLNNNENSFDFKNFSEWLFSLSSLDFVVIGTLAGVLIAKNLTINEQNTIGNFFELIGQVLLTINAQEYTLNSNRTNPNNISIEELNQKIEYLYKELNKIKKGL